MTIFLQTYYFWLDKGWIGLRSTTSTGASVSQRQIMKSSSTGGASTATENIYTSAMRPIKLATRQSPKTTQTKGPPRRDFARQVWMNRGNPNIQGSIFFSAKAVMRNPLGVADSLTYSLFERKALIPGFAFKSNPPAPPKICRAKGSPSTIKLAWQVCSTAPEKAAVLFCGLSFRWRRGRLVH